MKLRHLPNFISILRILLVIPLVFLLMQQRYVEAFAIYAVAAASDALDGYLARRNAWTSALGGILDPIGDKLLLVSTYVCLALLELLPLWLAALVVLRDLVIVSGAAAFYFLVGRYEMAPSLASKLNTVFQLALPALVLLERTILSVPPSVISALVAAVTLTTLLSGGHYVWHWGRKARAAARGG
ncbi:MAG: CDP-alcohol phosphatidyltransferase family protein [Pseudomonadota bacterium]